MDPILNELQEAARKLLLARAERLRQRPEEEEGDLYWAAEFPLGGEAFALPLETLLACQPLRLVTSVPLSDPHLAGVVRFQRRILAVLSLAGVMGVKGWRRDPSVMLVLKGEKDRLAVVDCEEIPRSVGLPRKAVLTALAQARPGDTVRMEKPGAGALHLIDPSRFFPGVKEGSHVL